MHSCVCTLGYPVSSKNEIEHGLSNSGRTSSKYNDFDLDNNPSKVLSKIRKKNLNRPIVGHINFNFLEVKFDALKHLIEDKLDVLVITETKIDDSYPTSRFEIKGFGTPFRRDRNKHGEGFWFIYESIYLAGRYHLLISLMKSRAFSLN